MGLFVYRLVGAALLDASMYEGIEHDRHATGQAFAAVLLASVAAGIGASGWYGPDLKVLAMLSGLALVTWLAWAMLMYQIGTRVLPEPQTEADFGELLRTIGFASAPGLLQVFAVLPRVTIPVYIVTTIWMFAAMVIGVRHALDYRSTGRALAVCGLGAALSVGLAIILGLFLSPAVL